VDTGLVLKVLEPIWAKKPETASRVRQRIENVLDFAKVRGYREGENPARWRGHLDKLLPARSRVRQVRHLAALPYYDLPLFIANLRRRNAFAARGLEFLILTAARTGEVIGARDKVEQAYRRGDMFEKRRRLMQQWATFCAAAPTRQDGNITALRSRMSA
jgi:integrase